MPEHASRGIPSGCSSDSHTMHTDIPMPFVDFSSLCNGGGGMWNVCVRGARVSGVGRRECLSKYALATGGQNRDGVSTCQSTKKQLCKIRRPCRAVEKTGPSTLTKECQICHQRTLVQCARMHPWCGVGCLSWWLWNLRLRRGIPMVVSTLL